MKRRHFIFPLVGIIAMAIVFIAARQYRLHSARSLALPVIKELGGTIGVILAEPFGSEYRLTFTGRRLSNDDLERLTALEPLTRLCYVGVALSNSAASESQCGELQQMLPAAQIIWIETDESQAVNNSPATD